MNSKKTRNVSLKWKLIGFVGILLVVICAINMAVSAGTIKRDLTASENGKLVGIAEKSAVSVNNILVNRAEIVKSIARRSELQELPFDSEELYEMLKEEAGKAGFSNIFMANTTGQLKLSSSIEDCANDDVYIAALNGETTYSAPMKRSSSTIINIAAPVQDQSGKVIGAIIATQNLADFSSSIMDGKYTTFMYDKSGDLIAHSEEAMLDEAQVEELPVYEENEKVKAAMINTSEMSGIDEWKLETDGNDYDLGYAKVEYTGWTIGILQDQQSVKSKISGSILKNMTSAILFLIVGIALMYVYISKKIISGITEMTQHLGILAKGNFKEDINEKLLSQNDEIGTASKALNDMRVAIGNMIGMLKQSSELMKQNSITLAMAANTTQESSMEISSATNEIAQGIQDEATDLSDILANINEFSDKIEDIKERIHTIDKEAEKTNGEVESGNEKAGELSASVATVNESFTTFTQKIEELSTKITNITEITTMINAIADQTNLLALNASIEAARAGEAGKGFAVVAEEIRKLAESSKQSAEKITDIIQETSQDADAMIDSTNYLDSELKNQITTIDGTVNSYERISTAISEVVSQVTEITQAVQEIAKDKNNIVEKIENCTALSEEISASTEEVAASAKEMNALADQVDETAKGIKEISESITIEISKFRI